MNYSGLHTRKLCSQTMETEWPWQTQLEKIKDHDLLIFKYQVNIKWFWSYWNQDDLNLLTEVKWLRFLTRPWPTCQSQTTLTYLRKSNDLDLIAEVKWPWPFSWSQITLTYLPTEAKWPWEAANITGVLPKLSAVFTRALWLNNNCRDSTWSL